MDEQLIDETAPPPKAQPVFLLVLCILTWIGSGLIAVANTLFIAYSWLQRGEPYFSWIVTGCAVFLAGAALCAWGAFLMWKRRRRGFYPYLVGELAPVAIMIMNLVRTDPSHLDAFRFWLWIGWIILPVVFIVLYGLNLKHLDR